MKVCCLTARKQRRCGAGGSFSAREDVTWDRWCIPPREAAISESFSDEWASLSDEFGMLKPEMLWNAVNSEGKTIWQRTDQHQWVWEKVGEHVARRKEHHQSIHEKPVSMPVRVVEWVCLQHYGPPRLDGMNVSQCLLVILYFGKLQSIIIFFSNMGTPSPSQCLLVIR